MIQSGDSGFPQYSQNFPSGSFETPQLEHTGSTVVASTGFEA